MHDFLSPDQIARRAQALELPLHLLAQRAGVHRTTLVRAALGETDMKISSLRKLTAALLTHERALLDHLLALHRPGAAPAPEPRSLSPDHEAAA